MYISKYNIKIICYKIFSRRGIKSMKWINCPDTLLDGYGNTIGTRDRDACTVDTCHPDDPGFMRMAEAVYPVPEKVL